MVVPVDREGREGESSLLNREPMAAAVLESVSSRKAGGRPRNQGITQTVSDLCFTLYKGMYIM